MTRNEAENLPTGALIFIPGGGKYRGRGHYLILQNDGKLLNGVDAIVRCVWINVPFSFSTHQIWRERRYIILCDWEDAKRIA